MLHTLIIHHSILFFFFCFCLFVFIFVLLFCFVLFFDPFQAIHRSKKQSHFPVIIFHCVAEKKQTTTLGLASHHAMIKVFDLSSFHQFLGKPLTLRHAALCLHLTGVWPILNAAVQCSSEGLMVKSVTNEPLIELIYLENDGVELKLHQNKRNWCRELTDLLWRFKKKGKKRRQQKYFFIVSMGNLWPTKDLVHAL